MTRETPRRDAVPDNISASPATGEGATQAGRPPPRDYDIRIARDGTWFYRGSPINRKPLVKLFSSVLRREADGSFWLVTPAERGRITVEDAPFTAVELDAYGRGRDQVLAFRTNLDERIEAGPEHPLRVENSATSGEPRPYILVRQGLEALLLRQVFYRLAELAVPGDDREDVIGVWSKGRFFPLGKSP